VKEQITRKVGGGSSEESDKGVNLETSLDELSRWWTAFVENTHNFHPLSIHYKSQRDETIVATREFIGQLPVDIQEQITTIESDNPYEKRLVKLAEELEVDHPGHPQIEIWKSLRTTD
jgi:hypothetical protein